jgi:hypothetical protein
LKLILFIKNLKPKLLVSVPETTVGVLLCAGDYILGSSKANFASDPTSIYTHTNAGNNSGDFSPGDYSSRGVFNF